MGEAFQRKSLLSLRSKWSPCSEMSDFRWKSGFHESGKQQWSREQPTSPFGSRNGGGNIERWKQLAETAKKNQEWPERKVDRDDKGAITNGLSGELLDNFSECFENLVADSFSENPICDSIKVLKGSIDDEGKSNQCLTESKAVASVLPFNMSRLFYLPVTINGFKCLGLLDSGCSTSIIDYDFLISALGSQASIESWNSSTVIELACGQEAEVRGVTDLEFVIHSRRFKQRCVVSSDKGNPFILGLPVLCNLNIDIDFENKTYRF